METSILASLLRNKLPDAVVRDDSCDVVRVAWNGHSAYVETHEGTGFQVRVALRPISGASESVPAPQVVDFAEDPSEAAEKTVHWLRKVATLERLPNF